MQRYILITPARNEAIYIDKTINSVISQNVKPVKWIIVNDGSTDNTADIVKKYLASNTFIELAETKDYPNRDFGSKVNAFNFGYEKIQNLKYDFIGNLDGDVSFAPEYFEEILKRFDQNNKIGIAGGVRYDFVDGKLRKIHSSRSSVAGAFQLFRRECFEKIGGYMPLKYGGIDAVAETMARMQGWEVKSFTDLIIYHYKPTGSSANNIFKQRFRAGVKFFMIGYHPVFSIIRFASRINQKPYFIGSIVSLCGYLWANLRNFKRQVPADFVKYLRAEQIFRIKMFFRKGKDPAFKS